MKQKVKITREQIESYFVSLLPVEVYAQFRNGRDVIYTRFPESIEVEVDVDVPDNLATKETTQEKLAKGLIDHLKSSAEKVYGPMPEPSYKLMAKAYVLNTHIGGLWQEDNILFESHEEAEQYYSPYKHFMWPARIDPATGMYKVPVKA
jgi:hypothetical protein